MKAAFMINIVLVFLGIVAASGSSVDESSESSTAE